ncbi:MAG TPA: YcjF family protein [Xanthobacteraceae bacterium]|jgi:uncharacterized protein (DUF697 family)|nr:YcjF family protein [Xanthobacteraceae bacterium]
MTRKQLPKAIRTNEAPRGTAARAALDEAAQAARAPFAHDAFEAEPAPVAFSRPVANDQFPARAIDAGRQAERRRLAGKIVERHRTYAAIGGLSPLPILNVAGVTAMIMRMVKQLSELYGVPFERDRTRSLVIGIMGGAVPTGLGTVTASTLAFALPGSGIVGLAVTALTAGALTRGIGLVFIELFESAAMPLGAVQIEHA